ncbi:unnamed protein product [Blepharisma stoltei]|uniref:Uncharacterized protein n=1 Tax=Blepharisma stoltei TaxID=1481888 RepID=A0AAU9IAP3_9CILI|nr:unnamed protein product [Blepharisma stoltei]
MGVMDEEYFYKEKTDLAPDDQREADHVCDNLRMKFIKDWALNKNLDTYKTDAERDWAYIVKREYRFAVNLRSFFDGMFVGNALQLLVSWRRKKLVFTPLFMAWPVVYYWQIGKRFSQHNRRFFEMLNVGTEFELGAERNRVLEECNRIARRADF